MAQEWLRRGAVSLMGHITWLMTIAMSVWLVLLRRMLPLVGAVGEGDGLDGGVGVSAISGGRRSVSHAGAVWV